MNRPTSGTLLSAMQNSIIEISDLRYQIAEDWKMSLETTLSADIVTAMKAKDQTRLTALRMLKTALMNKNIEKGRDLETAEELAVLSMLVKQRRDSIDQYTKGGRTDLADKEQAEIVILETYQPASASDEEIAAAVAAAVGETGAPVRPSTARRSATP